MHTVQMRKNVSQKRCCILRTLWECLREETQLSNKNSDIDVRKLDEAELKMLFNFFA